uniref:Protein kinase domain-containing protein n=1 Tax=Pyramimonas obovata TaxID=1411642 RepID=A0A7S0WWQ8_9CHLO|mmetsp:Transcript_7262/g.14776  ORF Transcript_7262/g.14776 Transcript_7262/m.14776 type:complete len:786 (+) Transcript_7262:114-2471(+)
MNVTLFIRRQLLLYLLISGLATRSVVEAVTCVAYGITTSEACSMRCGESNFWQWQRTNGGASCTCLSGGFFTCSDDTTASTPPTVALTGGGGTIAEQSEYKTCQADPATCTQLWLHSSGLTGTIPTEIGLLTQLKHAFLNNNDMTGKIPTEIGQLKQLEQIDLSINGLTGMIPTEIGRLTKLTKIHLDNNDLMGTIPTEIGQLAQLESIDLSNNGLTGTIPTEIERLMQLTVMDLRSNYLTGTIPTEVGQLTQLGVIMVDPSFGNGASPSSNATLGVTVGGIIGGVAAGVLLWVMTLALVCWLRNRRKGSRAVGEQEAWIALGLPAMPARNPVYSPHAPSGSGSGQPRVQQTVDSASANEGRGYSGSSLPAAQLDRRDASPPSAPVYPATLRQQYAARQNVGRRAEQHMVILRVAQRMEMLKRAIAKVKDYKSNYLLDTSQEGKVGASGVVKFGIDKISGRRFAFKFFLEDNDCKRHLHYLTLANSEYVLQIWDMIPADPNLAAMLQDPSHEAPVDAYNCLVSLRGDCTLLDIVFSSETQLDNISKQAIMHQIFNAVENLHSLGIVHRDLKLHTIVQVTMMEGTWKLIDMTTCAEEGEETEIHYYTLRYAAPEVVQATISGADTMRVSTKSDMWSLGVVLYELYSGNRLFDDSMPEADIVTELCGPGELNLASGLCNGDMYARHIISKLLVKDPAARWSADEMRVFFGTMDTTGIVPAAAPAAIQAAMRDVTGEAFDSLATSVFANAASRQWAAAPPLATHVDAPLMSDDAYSTPQTDTPSVSGP